METLSAAVRELDQKQYLVIGAAPAEIMIPLCEDKPTEVKAAFNSLILRIKEGPFQLELTDSGEDLFSQVAAEYIKQLNREVREVHSEMVQHDLVEE